jgi:hypothetical protein
MAGFPDNKTVYEAYLQAYGSREVPFQFRGIGFRFVLSPGLFSSADVDRGTRALLKVFSRLQDEDLEQGRPLPRRVLDSGCGAGIIGICAARALAKAAEAAGTETAGTGAAGRAEAAGIGTAGPLRVRAQDRDDLARIFTQGNGARNGLGAAVLEARTEALLEGEAGETWDLILSNIPAKAGEPVLRDFIRRSAGLLAPGGRVLIVVVKTLADFFRSGIGDSGAALLREEAGPEHHVFVYGASPGGAVSGATVPGGAVPREAKTETAERPPLWRPAYLRHSAPYEMEGIAYRITSVHGAAEFDRPGGAAETAAKLLCRLGAGILPPAFPEPSAAASGEPFKAPFRAPRVLIHEGGQGHFPLWFLEFLKREGAEPPQALVLHGRNILALEAARGSITEAGHGGGKTELHILPGADLGLDLDLLAARLPGGDPPDGENRENPAQQCYGFIAAFPDVVPGTRPYNRIWEGLGGLLLPGGIALIALPAVEADRLIKRKPPGFTRLGDLKRRGFRALAVCRSGP